MRRLIGLVLGLVLIVRSMVPVGFMLAPTAVDGSLALMICTGAGPLDGAALADVDSSPTKPGKPGAGSHDLCAFAPAFALAVPAEGAYLLAPVALVGRAELPSVADRLPPARAGPSLGSRAPPVVS